MADTTIITIISNPIIITIEIATTISNVSRTDIIITIIEVTTTTTTAASTIRISSSN